MEEAPGLFGFYLLDDAGLRKFSAGAQINTDDRTLLEYHAPRSLLVHGLEDQNREAILREQRTPLPEDLPPDLLDRTLTDAAATSINQDDAGGADRFLLALDHRPVSLRMEILRGRAALARSNFQTAFRAFDAALAIAPESMEAQWGLAEANRHFGNNEKARAALTEILAQNHSYLPALRSLVKLDVDFSRWPEAEETQRRLIGDDPSSGAADLAQLADILLHENKEDEAYATMLHALTADPYNYQAHLDVAEFLAKQKRWVEARQHLEFVMRFYPDQDAAIYPLLFRTDQALGDPRAAAQAIRFGLRVFPDNSELQQLNLPLSRTGFSLSGLFRGITQTK
jgi:tetratricopeptide (TPR) repeat protein